MERKNQTNYILLELVAVAFLLFHETLSVMEVTGIVVVILGIYLVKKQYE